MAGWLGPKTRSASSLLSQDRPSTHSSKQSYTVGFHTPAKHQWLAGWALKPDQPPRCSARIHQKMPSYYQVPVVRTGEPFLSVVCTAQYVYVTVPVRQQMGAQMVQPSRSTEEAGDIDEFVVAIIFGVNSGRLIIFLLGSWILAWCLVPGVGARLSSFVGTFVLFQPPL